MSPIEYVMIAAAYLSGSIPFGLIVYYLLTGKDVRSAGSRNIGATNVARNAGALAGLATLALDILKGFAPIAVCPLLGISADSWVITAVAFAAVFGHMFPVWLAFRGGKGVATGLGVFLGLAWHVALMALAVFILCVALTRIVSLSSIVASIAFVALAFALGPWLGIGLNLQIGALAGAALIILKHHENIARLLRGEEKRFGLGGRKGGQDSDGEGR